MHRSILDANNPLEPYRLFFPLGILLGLLGVSVWPIYYLGWGLAPSAAGHVGLQIQGFILCFALGFLMTAVPKFLGSPPVRFGPQLILAGLVMVSAVGFWLDRPRLAESASLLVLCEMGSLLFQAFRARIASPPEPLAAVLLGLLCGLIGGLLKLLVVLGQVDPSLMLLGRLLAASAWNARFWRFPRTRTALSWAVYLSHWMLIVGLFWSAAMPRFRVEALHLVFVGGFSILILAVGMRVTLAHGGYPLAWELRSRPLRIGVALFLLVTLTRVGAGFAPDAYLLHLALAGALWMIGLSVWGAVLVSRILFRAPQQDPRLNQLNPSHSDLHLLLQLRGAEAGGQPEASRGSAAQCAMVMPGAAQSFERKVRLELKAE